MFGIFFGVKLKEGKEERNEMRCVPCHRNV
jgi:hypothetical protein